jgi:hypothetical protein
VLCFLHVEVDSIFEVLAQDGGVVLAARQEVDQRCEEYLFFALLQSSC